MDHIENHYKEVCIYKTHGLNSDYYLVLNESSFWDITFDRFKGRNIKLIHNNAFSKSAKMIKEFVNLDGYINHEPPEYDIWKILSGLVNIENINVYLNITEIPLHAFNEIQMNLTNITITTPNYIRIKMMAFCHLDNLRYLNFKSKIYKIESEAFEFRRNSFEKLFISFFDEINGDAFDINSFEAIQRPVEVIFESGINYLPKSSFKAFLNNQYNRVKVNGIDCYECQNSWIIKLNKEKQTDIKCSHNKELTMFSDNIKNWLSNCERINQSFYDTLKYPIFIFGFISFGLLLLFGTLYIRKKRKTRALTTFDLENTMNRTNYLDGNENENPQDKFEDEYLTEILKSENLLIQREKIEILFQIGRGSFGYVNKAILKICPDEYITVAIKTVSKGINFKFIFKKMLN